MRRWILQPKANLEFDKVNLILFSTFLRFRAFVLTCARAEKPFSQRYVVAKESSTRKASSDTCG